MNARRIMELLFLSAIALASLLLIANIATAQQKFSINATGEGIKSRYVQQHVIDVGDVPGHQVRILEVQRTGGQLVIDGVKVVESWDRGMSDYTNGVGPARGYGTWLMEDGSKIFLEWSGTSYTESTATGSRRGTFHGANKITGGTGRFTKIRGMTTSVTKFDTDPVNGYNRATSKGEYWFEQ
jgi:hypothetical protein